MFSRLCVSLSASAWLAMALAGPAAAGTWEYDPDRDMVLHDSRPVAPWYRQHPWKGTGPGYYYSHHPRHVPGYPRRLTGYPVPIHEAHRPLPAPRAEHAPLAAHVEWCAARYRSYDAWTDTYQPYRGRRRPCRSPWW